MSNETVSPPPGGAGEIRWSLFGEKSPPHFQEFIDGVCRIPLRECEFTEGGGGHVSTQSTGVWHRGSEPVLIRKVGVRSGGRGRDTVKVVGVEEFSEGRDMDDIFFFVVVDTFRYLGLLLSCLPIGGSGGGGDSRLFGRGLEGLGAVQVQFRIRFEAFPNCTSLLRK